MRYLSALEENGVNMSPRSFSPATPLGQPPLTSPMVTISLPATDATALWQNVCHLLHFCHHGLVHRLEHICLHLDELVSPSASVALNSWQWCWTGGEDAEIYQAGPLAEYHRLVTRGDLSPGDDNQARD